MASLQNYFTETRKKPKFKIGDRVKGEYSGIPIRGTVLNSGSIKENQVILTSVFLDLPIPINGIYRSIITIEEKKLKESK